MELQATLSPIPTGWVLLRGQLRRHGQDFSATLTVEAKEGTCSYPLPVTLNGRIFELMHLPENVSHLMLEPMHSPGVFELQALSLESVGFCERLVRMWRRILPMFFKQPRARRHKAGLRAYTPFVDLYKAYQIAGAIRGDNVGPHLDFQYRLWRREHLAERPDSTALRARAEQYAYRPLISLLTPVYNTDTRWLQKAVASVQAQCYPHWELCLVNDASTMGHVREVLDEYALLDRRIKVKHLPHNEGIAGASRHALSCATGEFVGLLDHDDELSAEALLEVVAVLNEYPETDLVYSDEDKLEEDGAHVQPFFKPDWSPELLLSMNYITHFSVFRRALLLDIGGFRPGFDGSQDYDLLLRFTERTDKIRHVPQVLYHWRKSEQSAAGSVTAKPMAYTAARRAIEDALQRRGTAGAVLQLSPGRYRVRYQLSHQPLVSIITCAQDGWPCARECLKSVETKTDYPKYEIIIVDSSTAEDRAAPYRTTISKKWSVYRYAGSSTMSALYNFGVGKAKGDYLLFLDSGTRPVMAGWLLSMLEQVQCAGVGVVGGKLIFDDQSILHAGMVLGVNGVAAPAFKRLPANRVGYFGLADVIRNCGAVSGACMMLPKSVYERVGGFDEKLNAPFNDLDLCLRVRQQGYRIVYDPSAVLCYDDCPRKGIDQEEDKTLFLTRWGNLIDKGDPYYNPNLTLAREDWSLRI